MVKGLMKIFNVENQKRVLSTMPLHTAYGYSLNLWLPLLTGMTLVQANDSYDLDALANKIIKQKVNILFASNQMIHQLYESDNMEIWKSLDTIITGQDTVAQEIQSALHKAYNVSIHASIGFTAFGSVVAVDSPNYKLKDLAGKTISQLGSKTNSYGRPIPGIAFKIVDPNEPDIELGANEKGIIMLKGASLSCASNGVAQKQLIWQNSGFEGSIDHDGFVMLAKNSIE